MNWVEKTKSFVKTGQEYYISGIGKIKVIGNISQFGTSGGLFVECQILESENSGYAVGSYHELNAEFMR